MKNILLTGKKEINQFIRYTQSAAEVDAFNILYVRKIRGQHSSSYSEIKSFYLTTDRALNQILINEKPYNIVETIFPSQLYLLHSISFNETDEEDYKTFIKFLKRRTSEFKLTGKDVLSYISQIRSYTNETKHIKEVLKAFLDLKYDATSNMDFTESKNLSITDFAKTFLDNKLSAAEYEQDQFKSIYTKALEDVSILVTRSKFYAKIFDFIITLIIVPIIPICIGIYQQRIWLTIILTIIFEAIKVVFLNNGKLLISFRKKVFQKLIKRSSFFKLTDLKNEFYKEAISKYENSERNIWKKDLSN